MNENRVIWPTASVVGGKARMWCGVLFLGLVGLPATATAQFSAVQGSNRTFSGQAGSLTLTPGVPGYIFDGQWRPFVTGVVPVVGNPIFAPPVPAPPVVISPLRQSIQRLQAGERPPRPPRSSRSRPRTAMHRAGNAPPARPSSAERGES